MAHINITPYMKLPFVDKGRSHDGVDCYGLHWLMSLEQRGIELPSYAEEYMTCHDSREITSIILRERLSTWEQVDQNDVEPWDLVVLRILGQPWHCGTMLSRHKFLHIERHSNVCQDKLDSLRWERRIEGFYRWKQ